MNWQSWRRTLHRSTTAEGGASNKQIVPIATRLVSGLAWLSYGILAGVVVYAVGTSVLPPHNEPLVFGVTRAVTILISVGGVSVFPNVSREFRLGALPAWVGILSVLSLIPDRSPDSTRASSMPAVPPCASVVTRTSPATILMDSVLAGLRGDLTVLEASYYADMIYAAVRVYWAQHNATPPNLGEALRAVGVSEEESHRFAIDLGYFRLSHANGGVFLDAWFCGYDSHCGTCDDYVGTYIWPNGNSTVAVPDIVRRGDT